MFLGEGPLEGVAWPAVWAGSVGGAWPHLVGLGAGVEQALLDGELQQVVILIPQGLAAPRAQHRVPRRHLEHPRLHLARERPACCTPCGGP